MSLFKKSAVKSWIAAFTIGIYFLTQSGISDASEILPKKSSVNLPGLTLFIPESLGEIEEVVRGKSDKTLVYIQDAHDSLEAQENIARLVRNFVKKNGIKTVFEEGYEGSVPTEKFFGFIKDFSLRQKVSHFFLDKLRIGGAEYAHINRRDDFRLIGVENSALYRQNLDWYKKNARLRAQTEEELNEILAGLQKLTHQWFSAEVKEWIKTKESFEKNQISMLDYLIRVTAKFTPSSRSQFPQIAAVIRAHRNQIAPERLDAKALFSEIEQLESHFMEAHLKEEKSKKLFGYLADIRLLKRLNQIQVVPAEFEALQSRLKELSTETVAGFIFEHTRKSIVLSREWETSIQNAIGFYDAARARDQSAVENIKKYWQADEKSAVLVFGGFHKTGLRASLVKEGYSLLIISPRITGLNSKHRAYYQQLMSRGHHEFEAPFYLSIAARPEPIFSTPNGLVEIQAVSRTFQTYPGAVETVFLDQVTRDLKRSARSEVRGASEAVNAPEKVRAEMVRSINESLTDKNGVRDLTLKEAIREWEAFKGAVWAAPGMKDFFDPAHFDLLSLNLDEGGKSAEFELGEGLILKIVSLIRYEDGDRRTEILKIRNGRTGAEKIVGYIHSSVRPPYVPGQDSPAMSVGFDIFIPFRGGIDSELPFKSRVVLIQALRFLRHRHPEIGQFEIMAVGQLANSFSKPEDGSTPVKIGDRLQNVKFYLDAGFFPWLSQKESDALWARRLRGENISDSEINSLMARRDPYWILPLVSNRSEVRSRSENPVSVKKSFAKVLEKIGVRLIRALPIVKRLPELKMYKRHGKRGALEMIVENAVKRQGIFLGGTILGAGLIGLTVLMQEDEVDCQQLTISGYVLGHSLGALAIHTYHRLKAEALLEKIERRRNFEGSNQSRSELRGVISRELQEIADLMKGAPSIAEKPGFGKVIDLREAFPQGLTSDLAEELTSRIWTIYQRAFSGVTQYAPQDILSFVNGENHRLLLAVDLSGNIQGVLLSTNDKQAVNREYPRLLKLISAQKHGGWGSFMLDVYLHELRRGNVKVLTWDSSLDALLFYETKYLPSRKIFVKSSHRTFMVTGAQLAEAVFPKDILFSDSAARSEIRTWEDAAALYYDLDYILAADGDDGSEAGFKFSPKKFHLFNRLMANWNEAVQILLEEISETSVKAFAQSLSGWAVSGRSELIKAYHDSGDLDRVAKFRDWLASQDAASKSIFEEPLGKIYQELSRPKKSLVEKNKKDPKYTRFLFQTLLTRLETVDWKKDKEEGLVPDLSGYYLGKTNDRGKIRMNPYRNFRFSWNILGFEEKGWKAHIQKIFIRKGAYHLKVVLTKKDRDPVERIFRIGPNKHHLRGSKNAKGAMRQVWGVNLIKGATPDRRFSWGKETVVSADRRFIRALHFAQRGEEIPEELQRLEPRYAASRGTVYFMKTENRLGNTKKQIFLSVPGAFEGQSVTPVFKRTGERDYEIGLEVESRRTGLPFIARSFKVIRNGEFILPARESGRMEWQNTSLKDNPPATVSELMLEVQRGIVRGVLDPKLRRFTKNDLKREKLLTVSGKIHLWSPHVRLDLPKKLLDKSYELRFDPAPASFGSDAWIASLWMAAEYEEIEGRHVMIHPPLPVRGIMVYRNGRFLKKRPFTERLAGFNDVRGEIADVKRTFRDLTDAYWYRYWLSGGASKHEPRPREIQIKHGRDNYLYNLHGKTITALLGTEFNSGTTVRGWAAFPEIAPDARGVVYWNDDIKKRMGFVLFKNGKYHAPVRVRVKDLPAFIRSEIRSDKTIEDFQMRILAEIDELFKGKTAESFGQALALRLSQNGIKLEIGRSESAAVYFFRKISDLQASRDSLMEAVTDNKFSVWDILSRGKIFLLHALNLFLGGISLPHVTEKTSSAGDLEEIHYFQRFQIHLWGFLLLPVVTGFMDWVQGSFSGMLFVASAGIWALTLLVIRLWVGGALGHELTHVYQFYLIEEMRRNFSPDLNYQTIRDLYSEQDLEKGIPVIGIPAKTQLKNIAVSLIQQFKEARTNLNRSEVRTDENEDWPGQYALMEQAARFFNWRNRDAESFFRRSIGSDYDVTVDVSPHGWTIIIFPYSSSFDHVVLSWIRQQDGNYEFEIHDRAGEFRSIGGFENRNPLLSWDWSPGSNETNPTTGMHFTMTFDKDLLNYLPQGTILSHRIPEGRVRGQGAISWKMEFSDPSRSEMRGNGSAEGGKGRGRNSPFTDEDIFNRLKAKSEEIKGLSLRKTAETIGIGASRMVQFTEAHPDVIDQYGLAPVHNKLTELSAEDQVRLKAMGEELREIRENVLGLTRVDWGIAVSPKKPIIPNTSYRLEKGLSRQVGNALKLTRELQLFPGDKSRERFLTARAKFSNDPKINKGKSFSDAVGVSEKYIGLLIQNSLRVPEWLVQKAIQFEQPAAFKRDKEPLTKRQLLLFLGDPKTDDGSALSGAEMKEAERRVRKLFQALISQWHRYGFSSEDDMWGEIISILGMKIEKFRSEDVSDDDVAGFVYQSVRNGLTDKGRREKRHKHAPLQFRNADDEGTVDLSEFIPSGEPEPNASAILREETVKLHQYSHRLSLGEFQAIEGVLRGDKYEDIAKRLNVPLGTIKSRIERAKRKLHEMYDVSETDAGLSMLRKKLPTWDDIHILDYLQTLDADSRLWVELYMEGKNKKEMMEYLELSESQFGDLYEHIRVTLKGKKDLQQRITGVRERYSARSEVRMISSYALKEKFGDLFDPVILRVDKNRTGIYNEQTGARVAIRLPWSQFVYRSMDNGEEKLSRVYKLQYYSSDSDKIIRELEMIWRLQRAGVQGVPKIRRVGILYSGGVWAELEGIENGRSLEHKVFVSVPRFFEVFIRAAEIMKEVHGAGVLHTDIKPGNILINDERKVEWIDFEQGGFTVGYSPLNAEKRPMEDQAEDTDVFSFIMTLADVLDDILQGSAGGIEQKEYLRKMRNRYLGMIFKSMPEGQDYPRVREPFKHRPDAFIQKPRDRWPRKMEEMVRMLMIDHEGYLSARSELRTALKTSENIPAGIFLSLEELIGLTGTKIKEELTALADRTRGSKIKIVIHSADFHHPEYLKIKEMLMSYPHVHFTAEGFEGALKKHGAGKSQRNVSVFSRADLLKEMIRDDRVKYLRLQQEGDLWASYLLAVTEPGQALPGLNQSKGYYEVTDGILSEQLRAYQASLVVKIAA